MERRWSFALAVLFIVLLGWYLVYTQRIVSALRADAATYTELFSEVQGAIADPDPDLDTSLWEIQEILLATGIPIVVAGPADTVLAVQNLPFDVDLDSAEDQERIRRYMRRLDVDHPPIGDPTLQHIHYGDTPEVRSLVLIPWLQAGGLVLTALIGFAVIRTQRRAEAERAWTAMARELAHQLGTPISSLQGWLEVMRLPEKERPGSLRGSDVADALEEDLHRLERISRRFELIGREPDLEPLQLHEVVEDLEQYLRARLPRLGAGVTFRVEVDDALPQIRGNTVLLTWALENVVKNSLDALAGTGGKIALRAYPANQYVALRISDTGPGVDPEVRGRIFDPGVTTKANGWGVGLALSRRIVEGVHGGRIELLEGAADGATFVIYLPAHS
ncbi:MAG: ATP-binding protein [Longimicrobiales bacterium]|nr:ATP-binding protein [Longimicrobiales bacterium]